MHQSLPKGTRGCAPGDRQPPEDAHPSGADPELPHPAAEAPFPGEAHGAGRKPDSDEPSPSEASGPQRRLKGAVIWSREGGLLELGLFLPEDRAGSEGQHSQRAQDAQGPEGERQDGLEQGGKRLEVQLADEKLYLRTGGRPLANMVQLSDLSPVPSSKGKARKDSESAGSGEKATSRLAASSGSPERAPAKARQAFSPISNAPTAPLEAAPAALAGRAGASVNVVKGRTQWPGPPVPEAVVGSRTFLYPEDGTRVGGPQPAAAQAAAPSGVLKKRTRWPGPMVLEPAKGAGPLVYPDNDNRLMGPQAAGGQAAAAPRVLKNRTRWPGPLVADPVDGSGSLVYPEDTAPMTALRMGSHAAGGQAAAVPRVLKNRTGGPGPLVSEAVGGSDGLVYRKDGSFLMGPHAARSAGPSGEAAAGSQPAPAFFPLGQSPAAAATAGVFPSYYAEYAARIAAGGQQQMGWIPEPAPLPAHFTGLVAVPQGQPPALWPPYGAGGLESEDGGDWDPSPGEAIAHRVAADKHLVSGWGPAALDRLDLFLEAALRHSGLGARGAEDPAAARDDVIQAAAASGGSGVGSADQTPERHLAASAAAISPRTESLKRTGRVVLCCGRRFVEHSTTVGDVLLHLWRDEVCAGQLLW